MRLDCGNRCRVCNVQRGCIGTQTGSGSELEQRVVLALGVCRYQLHTQLGVCGICGDRLVGGRLLIDDVAAAAGEGALVVGGLDPLESPRFCEQGHGVGKVLECDDSDEASGVDDWNHAKTTALKAAKRFGQ